MDLVQKALVRQNITIGPPMYRWMEMVLKADVKAVLSQQANLVGSCTVGNFTMVMATMTVNNYPRTYRWLRKPKDMKKKCRCALSLQGLVTLITIFPTFLHIVWDRWIQAHLIKRPKTLWTMQWLSYGERLWPNKCTNTSILPSKKCQVSSKCEYKT